jgi:2'-5' RNA ligase
VTSVRYHWWWRPGWRPGRRFYTFHVTFNDQPEVQALAAAARDRLAGLPGLDLIPAQWLHLTMQGVGFADEVTDEDVVAITAAARSALAGVAPVTVSIGPPVAVGEGITCHASPADALDPVRNAVRAGIGDVWGPEKVLEAAEWTPHVSVAYASEDGPAEPFEAALGGLADTATATVRAVDLIKLGRDNRLYEWETMASLPLGAYAAAGQ